MRLVGEFLGTLGAYGKFHIDYGSKFGSMPHARRGVLSCVFECRNGICHWSTFILHRREGWNYGFNADPTATITSHASGIELQEGATINFRGAVSDPDDTNNSLLATWYIGESVARRKRQQRSTVRRPVISPSDSTIPKLPLRSKTHMGLQGRLGLLLRSFPPTHL